MIPIFRGVVLMLLCCLGRTLANYDPKNYEDLYDFDDYFAHLNPDMLDAAFGYGASDLDGYGAFSDDDLLYFGNDEENYYNRFGFDPNDYSYELLNKGMPKIDCTEDSSGTSAAPMMVPHSVKNVVPADAACNITISGVDKVWKDKIPGGIDGVYNISGCFGGYPMYKGGKTKNESRLLWYSHVAQRWHLKVADPNDEQSPPLLRSSISQMAKRPNSLNSSAWEVIDNPEANQKDAKYRDAEVEAQCGDGQELPEPAKNVSSQPTRPLLTDEDTDKVLRSIYNQPGKDVDPSVNFFMLFLVALVGSSVVMGVPYILQSKQSNGKTIAQMLEVERKQRAGHMN